MEYYSIFSHGQLLDNKKIKPVDRKLGDNYVPIIMFGTQSNFTLNSFTLFYHVIFTKNFGIHFLKELVDALKQYPQNYAKLYQVQDPTNIYQKAVRFLFDINLIDLRLFPPNKYRLFLKSDSVRQPLDVFLDSNDEMEIGKSNMLMDYTKPLVDKEAARLDPIFNYIENNQIVSIPMLHKIKTSKCLYGKAEDTIGLIFPYGLYKTTARSPLEFQQYVKNRFSELTKKIMQTTIQKNQRKLTFRNPTFHEIGGIFVFSCKVSFYKNIRNFQLPQQQTNTSVKAPSSMLFKASMNEETKKFEMRSIPNPEFEMYQHERIVSEHLENIEKKRKQRKQKNQKI
jgi:hypothetical protein